MSMPQSSGPAIIIRGDAANLQLPDDSVDLIVTSPPYFGLRSYQDGGEHYAGQVGDEATPTEYLDALIVCTAEWMRVLKPGGSIFVNLGDKYAADNRGSGGDKKRGEAKWAPAGKAGYAGEGFVRQKSLMMLPQRYAIRCIDELGLILRAEIVWAKPNGLPESVTDRVRRSHEQVFHFVKQPRYYSAVDEIREAQAHFHTPLARVDRGETNGNGQHNRMASNPLGKLPGSVWEIPTAPLKVPASLGIDHFAAYPPELVRRIVLGWSPRSVCSACGEGRRPVSERVSAERHNGGQHAIRPATDDSTKGRHGRNSSTLSIRPDYRITGEACACPDDSAPSSPGVVLDPFGGTGTTALVASVHGRVGISNDLSEDYCRLARWRTTDAKQRAKAAGKLAPVVAEQLDGQLDITELGR